MFNLVQQVQPLRELLELPNNHEPSSRQGEACLCGPERRNYSTTVISVAACEARRSLRSSMGCSALSNINLCEHCDKRPPLPPLLPRHSDAVQR